ncbi:MAG: tetratricopeptide repeat protein [Bacteroidota bacterium]|nr:tetratricopeptide repeat protein [Bacteroidota bacterium]
MLVIANILFAQKGGLPLAEEYYKGGEYLKAISIYQNFTTDLENAKKVYEKYTDCLIKTNNYIEAEKLVKKMIKWDPENPYYKIDAATLYLKQNKQKDAQKQFDKVIRYSVENPDYIDPITQNLNKNGYFDISKLVFLAARKVQGNDFIYALEMAEINKKEGKTAEMVSELIRLLLINHHDKEYLKARFQEYIVTDEEFKLFEAGILEKIQENPTQFIYNDILIWIYLQKKDFPLAFLQGKAYDRLMKTQGNKLMEIGKIAFENKEYDTAIEIYAYVEKEYRSSPNYGIARKLKIQAKEEKVKNTYPIDASNIRSLIADYKQYMVDLGRTQQTMEALRSMAILYGFYLDSKDTSVMYFREIISYPWVDAQFLNRCKLDMGDIYVLKNEPWEATLIYSQVEKDMKEQPLGHEAKLRNAKLSYYIGEFDLAKEHLDVLKLATTREIANDAIDLSVFIQDNTGLDDDSTHPALKAYCQAELLLFQNKYPETLKILDSLLKIYKDNAIVDEIYYLQAKVLNKTGNYKEALTKLQTIVSDYKTGIYADDAAFTIARMYEENFKDSEKAMALYNKFLIDFPASIYTAEARKRFRSLRGDNLNIQ